MSVNHITNKRYLNSPLDLLDFHELVLSSFEKVNIINSHKEYINT